MNEKLHLYYTFMNAGTVLKISRLFCINLFNRTWTVNVAVNLGPISSSLLHVIAAHKR